MSAVAHHQTESARFLELADAHLKTGDYRRSVDALERALTHAAAAVGRHWHIMPEPTRRQIGYILLMLARDGYISYTSARSFYGFGKLRQTINLARYRGDYAPARRVVRNSRRRVARTIAAANRAIAAKPHSYYVSLFE